MAPDAAAAGEMALIRLCFAADLPTPDEALRALKKNSSGGPLNREQGATPPRETVEARHPQPAEEKPSAQIIDINPPLSQRPSGDGTQIRGFGDVVRLAGEKRDAKLRTELESYVHIISFAQGRIELRLHEDAPGDLANRLTQRLKEWTGRAWIVSVTSAHQGEETLRGAREREVMDHPMVKRAMELFPGAEVTAIREAEAPIAPAPDELEEDAPIDPDDDAVAEAAAHNLAEQRKETGKA
jgi:DNA polymerase-3 subunit gamma/tau